MGKQRKRESLTLLEIQGKTSSRRREETLDRGLGTENIGKGRRAIRESVAIIGTEADLTLKRITGGRDPETAPGSVETSAAPQGRDPMREENNIATPREGPALAPTPALTNALEEMTNTKAAAAMNHTERDLFLSCLARY